MSLGISTDDVRNRILEKEPEKLKEELKAKQKELGLRDMVPQNNQDLLRQISDVGAEASHIREQMAEAKEKRLKRTEEERKAKCKPMNERIKLYFAQKERKAKEAYDSRRIIFRDGGFQKYEDSIRMMPYRVLVKEIRREEHGAVILPETHSERFPEYSVVAFGDGCEEIEKGLVIIAEVYAGTEIVSDGETYRIVTVDDIMGAVE